MMKPSWVRAILLLTSWSPTLSWGVPVTSPETQIISKRPPHEAVIDRMLLSIQEYSHYTQRQCELYLAVMHGIAPDPLLPKAEMASWLAARNYFLDERLAWEEIHTSSFYAVSSRVLDANWFLLDQERKNLASYTGKALARLKATDTELHTLLNEVLMIQNAKNLKAKLETPEPWIATLHHKYRWRFYDNTATYIPLTPLHPETAEP